MKIKTLLTVLSIITFVLFVSCSSSKSVKRNNAETAQTPSQNKADSLQQVKKDDLTKEELDQVNKVLGELQDVPFDFDKYSIPTQGLDAIKNDVAILNDMLKSRGKYIRITIEGHTDERGSDEYNLALGDRRGKTVKEYLLAVGFTEQMLHVISYGEERPKISGNTPEAWTANRRVHLSVE